MGVLQELSRDLVIVLTNRPLGVHVVNYLFSSEWLLSALQAVVIAALLPFYSAFK